jgi:serine/threonine protein kinase
MSMTEALFKLVNVEDHAQVVAIEDPEQVVAIEEDKWTPEVSGGFGQLYRGKYFIRDGAPFERMQYVVAKKNKLYSLAMSEDRMRDEVGGYRLSSESLILLWCPVSFQRKKLRRRMKEEAEIAKHLDRPTIAHYFGLFVKEDELTNDLADFFLVSDYVNGGPAKAFLDAHRMPYVAEKLVSSICVSAG